VFARLLLCCCVLIVSGLVAQAARNNPTEPASTFEVLVFEVEGCRYCDMLRRDVLPRWRSGTMGAEAPLRFIDINRVDIGKLALRGEVRMVPTVVLMKDGREVDRIDGYTGAEQFFQLIGRMLEGTR
jgi:thioredoxin-related protein